MSSYELGSVSYMIQINWDVKIMGYWDRCPRPRVGAGRIRAGSGAD